MSDAVSKAPWIGATPTPQHTPAPWFIRLELALQRERLDNAEIEEELLECDQHEIYAGRPQECTRAVLGRHDAHICDVDVSDVAPEDGKGRRNALANARLIASAPDLLDALVALSDYVDERAGDNERRALENARAAIARATGRRPE